MTFDRRESLLSSTATRQAFEESTAHQESAIQAAAPDQDRDAMDRALFGRAQQMLMSGPRATPPRRKKVMAIVRQMIAGLPATRGVRINAPVPKLMKGRVYKMLTFLHPTKGFRYA